MSRGTIILSIVCTAALVVVLWLFFTNSTFFDWAFARHQNTLSWISRPVLVLPYCYFAWRRWLPGVILAVLAIVTSMFWFPVPAAPREDVLAFLAMERALLQSGWTTANLLGALAVAVYLGLVALAFWRRSLWLGFAVVALGAGLKLLWSVLFSPEAGSAVAPFAIFGVLLLGLVLVLFRGLKKRS
ncbi:MULTISPECIES: hypothetical protein [Roseobacteraceae]|uniref:Uncharacterized protein n=1 Tax=Celeribacter baekdonensis B30 TaxID=1208323 RepID=K2K7M8_9RHOB|nr:MULTISPECIES: hypothetical protein [Roseobacteraceae]EKE73405.1 hypothetical protein B30_05062 [Celeribacter baekdonensis B30]KAB6717486.1 hypothetical protein C8029_02810 [Roseobacter sp. TSBP12]|tara:strand:- start:5551 stop:6108 length:558 start_codon:yes stop_codon:yes gene_type:complete